MSRSPSATTITPEQLDAAVQAAVHVARARAERARVEHRRVARIGLDADTAVAGRPHAARAGDYRKKSAE